MGEGAKGLMRGEKGKRLKGENETTYTLFFLPLFSF